MSCLEYPCETPGCDGAEFTNSPPTVCRKCGGTEFGSPIFDEAPESPPRDEDDDE